LRGGGGGGGGAMWINGVVGGASVTLTDRASAVETTDGSAR